MTVKTHPARFPRTTRADLPRVARSVLARCTRGRHVVGLSGPLGSGKSTLARAIGRILGVRHLPSPTYVLVRSSRIRGGRFSALIHADLYRLPQGRHLQNLGLAEAFSDPAALVLVEWPERDAGFRPPVRVRCVISGARRTFTVSSAAGGRHHRRRRR